MSVSIRSWTEGFTAAPGVAAVFDVFRCSTTIHTLFSRAEGPIYVAPSLAAVRDEPRVRELRVFSELSQPVTCRERFDNSPFQAASHAWAGGENALVATTTGTPAMFAARGFRRVYVGSLANFSALVAELSALNEPVTLIPAAHGPYASHVEDEITAQAVATALSGFANIPDFVRQCAEQAKERILASGRVEHLEAKLPTGVEDMRVCLDIDRFAQNAWLEFEDALFARVQGARFLGSEAGA